MSRSDSKWVIVGISCEVVRVPVVSILTRRSCGVWGQRPAAH